jgi:hypothetical protein
MCYQQLTRFYVAQLQLMHAIDLFCSREHLVSAITLAGAAEELLGKLAEGQGQQTALAIEISDHCELAESHFGRLPDRKTVRTLQNKARDALKHIGDGEVVSIDLEQEAVSMIERGIYNFRLLRPGPIPSFQRFEDNAAAWDRARIKRG